MALVALASTAPASACDRKALAKAIDAPLPRKADRTFDVAEAGSTDGGQWDVYLGRDGRGARSVLRTDYGETGRRVDRLVALSPGAYAVSRTQLFYSAPYAVKGSKVVRQTREVFLYCDGRLAARAKGSSTETRLAAARDVLATFDAAEIAPFLPKLRRR